MENKQSNSFPFVFIFVATICFVLILGWSFGWKSGYGLITIWSNFCLCMAALFQIVSIILLILLLITSIWGWAYSLGKVDEIKVGKWGMKPICEFLYTIFVCCAVLVFLFAAIGFGGITIGSMLYLIANIGSYVLYIVFRGKGFISKNGILEQVENFGDESEKTVVKKSKRSKKSNDSDDEEE